MSTSPPKPAHMPAAGLSYVIIMPVWGDHHVGLLLRFGIPFLLAPSNIGAFPNRSLSVRMMSRRADLAQMRQHAVYQQLATLVDLQEIEIDDIIDLSVPHRAMTECYLHAVRALDRPDDTVTIFPTPDCILSRHALPKIREKMDKGWRGVMICGLRITQETAGPVIDEMLKRPGGAEDIDERELTNVVLKNLHPIALTCSVDSNEFAVNWPSHVYWISPERDWLVAHCFHLHPIAVRGAPARIDLNTTIDGKYLPDLGVAADELFVCDDSDEFICSEISPAGKVIHVGSGSFAQKLVVRFSVACDELHRQFFPHGIRWHVSSDLRTPPETLRQIADCVAAVRRGSTLEEGRLMAIQFIRNTPPLLFLARGLARSLRLLRRLVGQASGGAAI